MGLLRVLTMVVRKPGFTSALGLSASGVGIALDPQRAGALMRMPPQSARGVTEMRAGVGGTFAALGTWALLRGTSEAYTAVGVTWLGAAAVRAVSMQVDQPEKDATFWAFLGLETTLGVAGLLAGDRGAKKEKAKQKNKAAKRRKRNTEALAAVA
jgi:hypothetical protein